MIVKMIQDLRNGMEKIQEMFTKGLEEPKNKHTNERYSRRNQQQDNWGRRRDTWPGG